MVGGPIGIGLERRALGGRHIAQHHPPFRLQHPEGIRSRNEAAVAVGHRKPQARAGLVVAGKGGVGALDRYVDRLRYEGETRVAHEGAGQQVSVPFTLEVGAISEEIVVRGYQSKDALCTPKCRANGRDVTFPDGRKLFMGSSGTGAPKDGSDAQEK